ncbi:hypothetical protein EB093_09860, partial [bacterium]|nr:hypothetical protein [bacterium]
MSESAIDMKKNKDQKNDWPALITASFHNVWKTMLIAYFGCNYLVQMDNTPSLFKKVFPVDPNDLPYKQQTQTSPADYNIWPMHSVSFPYNLNPTDSYKSGIRSYLGNSCMFTFIEYRWLYPAILTLFKQVFVDTGY